ncbi:MAG: hypothetical protein IKE25_09785 [Clostridia bacterium]|nr:hypothetical protein [Clostridia bacterium]
MLKTMKLADVSSALDISINTLSKWRQETDHPLTIYNRSYSEEQKQAALESVPSLGLIGAGMV